jgi:hypothetical protein
MKPETPQSRNIPPVGAQLQGLSPRQQSLAGQALYDIASGGPPEPAATRVRRLLKRDVPGLRDPDPDARGLLALRLLSYLPNGEMRLRALACMRKVPPAVRSAAAALLRPDTEVPETHP